MKISQRLESIPPIDIIEGPFDPQRAILNLINYFLFFIAVIAVVFVIYAGVLFITSGGDADKAAKARSTLIYAIIGVIVIVLSYSIVNWAANVFAPAIRTP